MDTKYLKYILTIAEYRNMTKAAEALYVSQSSLSQYLSRLESELGVLLFNRTKAELSVTPAGELYLEAARKVLDIHKGLLSDIEGLNKRGHIMVGVTSNFALRMLSEIIPQYKKEYPNVSIEITEVGLPQLRKLMIEGSVDIGIAATTPHSPYAGRAQILRVEDVLFAIPIHHPYTQINTSDAITVKELFEYFSDMPFVRSKKGSSIRSLTDELFEANDFTPKVICETNNTSASRSMIANQGSVGFISESCSVDRSMIRYYHVLPTLTRLNAVFTRKNWVRKEADDRFIEYLTDYFHVHTEVPYYAEQYV